MNARRPAKFKNPPRLRRPRRDGARGLPERVVPISNAPDERSLTVKVFLPRGRWRRSESGGSMSIFSRLRRRGDDGSAAESPPNTPPSAPVPKTPTAAAAPAPTRAPEAPRSPPPAPEPPRSAPREPVRAPGMIPPRGNVQAPVAGAIATPAAAASPRPSTASRSASGSGSASAKPAAPAPGAPAPAARAPVAVAGPTGGSLDLVIERALENSSVRRVAATDEAAPSAPPPRQEHGASSAFDDAALRETFEELAVAHVTPIRNAMMEVRFGEAQASWLELGRPALKSLRSMASEVGHEALVAALDGFVGALQTALE